ncbi:hypothetical protein A9X05_09175 [Mycobacterium sp. E3298]|nr:hypothetical protein [Mycobacterium sp. E3298]OBG93863.1 hypothetical protein A9X05_09175 [Mycobacterium sp. E3298]
MKKRIAIDQDQCLADILSEWLRRYNNEFNDNLKTCQMTHQNCHDITKAGKQFYKYLDDPEFFESLPLIEGSIEAVRELSYTYEIFVVTAPYNPNNVEPKSNWLKKYFPFIKEDNYVFTRNKSIVNADWLIDDKPGNFEGFIGKALLFDAPHNRTETRYRRMRNWTEVLNYFDGR